jgi:hypothetical protein
VIAGLTGVVFNHSESLGRHAGGLKEFLTHTPSTSDPTLLVPRKVPLHFAIIPDAGRLLFDTHDKFQPEYRLFTCDDGLERNCAILVHSNICAVNQVRQDPSGRALAVDVEPETGLGRLRLIALYQPPALDRAGPASKARVEAERLRKVVRAWRDHKSVRVSILGADANETRVGAADRIDCNGKWGPEHTGTIHGMIEEDGWHDTYRLCHPIDPDSLPSGPSGLGHTYFDARGGSSRIDYVLTHPSPVQLACHVDSTFRINSTINHRPLVFNIDLDFAKLRARKHTATASNEIRVDNLSEAERLELSAAVNSRIQIRESELCDSLDAATTESEIGAAYLTFRRGLLATSEQPCKPPGRWRGGVPPALSRAKRTKSLLHKLRCAVSKMDNDAIAATVACLSRLNVLKETGLDPVPNGEAQWSRWAEKSAMYVKGARARMRDAACQSRTGSAHLDATFRTPQGRGRFYRSAKTGWLPPLRVQSAINPATGGIERDPEVYKRLVREAVSRPFSTRKTGPAVAGWRPITAHERATGIPHWWAWFHARTAGMDPEERWDGLMRVCTPQELLDVLTGADGHKSAGHDGITIDLLKLIASPGSPVLHFLTCLVNAMLHTGCCPEVLKEGIIVMLSKSATPTEDVNKMRPITRTGQAACEGTRAQDNCRLTHQTRHTMCVPASLPDGWLIETVPLSTTRCD